MTVTDSNNNDTDTLATLPSRLAAQLTFIHEIDALKNVLRATKNLSNERHENSAEHSWHLAMMACVLAEHANRPVDVSRVIKMLLIHDLVEIDVGDQPLHGDHDPDEIAQQEAAAAERIFGLLPEDQRSEWLALWHEFEDTTSADAQFAKSVDRFQPLLCNAAHGGGSWVDYQVTRAQVETRTAAIGVGSTMLDRAAQALFDQGEALGHIKP